MHTYYLLPPSNQVKQLPISPSVPHLFLQKLGMQTLDGRIKADMQDK